jgi:hypothetical protein
VPARPGVPNKTAQNTMAPALTTVALHRLATVPAILVKCSAATDGASKEALPWQAQPVAAPCKPDEVRCFARTLENVVQPVRVPHELVQPVRVRHGLSQSVLRSFARRCFGRMPGLWTAARDRYGLEPCAPARWAGARSAWGLSSAAHFAAAQSHAFQLWLGYSAARYESVRRCLGVSNRRDRARPSRLAASPGSGRHLLPNWNG